jgi:hypothetical protein
LRRVIAHELYCVWARVSVVGGSCGEVERIAVMERVVADVVVIAGTPVATIVVGGARHVDDADVAEAVLIDGVAAVTAAVAVAVVAVSGHRSACSAQSREA